MISFRKNKKIFLATFFLTALLLGGQQLYVWAQGNSTNPDTSIFPTSFKEHLAADDITFTVDPPASDDAAGKANVLFLVDVGSSMLFTAKGKLPNWQAEYDKASGTSTQKTNTANAITAAQMAEATFGSGGLPSARYVTNKGRRDGRDLDPSNNAQNNPDNYYNTAVLGYPPNDSRLYKMKLVLWRMLDDADLFKDLRFALATTYQEENSPSVFVADFYRAPNYDANTTFPNGRGPAWATGNPYSYATSQYIEWGIDVDMYDETVLDNVYPGSNWFRVNRALLRVPFGEGDAHKEKFRMLINGVENTYVGTNTLFRTIDPEIIADGRTQLSTAIFPAVTVGTGAKVTYELRNQFGSKNLIYFSQYNNPYKKILQTGSGYQMYHWFGTASGEAAGSVIDFFSPPVNGLGAAFDAGNVNMAIAGNFPIRNRCDANWLVVFTAGDDSASYTAPEAVRDLYKYTSTNKVLRLKNPDLSADKVAQKANMELVSLLKPIRTMVIGFVDTADSTPTTVALRKTLDDMADYGDNGKLDNSAKAYFANDVPGLILAMRQVIDHIVADSKQAEIAISTVPSLVAPSGADAQGFLPGYTARSNDQWQGHFQHYGIFPVADDEGDTVDHTVSTDWNLEDAFTSYAANQASGRRVFFRKTGSNNGVITQIPFPDLSSTENSLAGLMGVQGDRLDPPAASNTPHPSNLLLRWVFGQDYDTSTKKSFPRNVVLADMGNSGYTLVAPTPADSPSIHAQPGYRDWILNTANNRPETIFLHTNDGLLHAIDPRSTDALNPTPWAREFWSFIPPNVLENQRLAGLKFNLGRSITPGLPQYGNADYKQTLSWINGGSKAGYTTDGSVYLYNLFGQAYGRDPLEWRTLLVGSMGRGGAGFYVMDVTNPADPTQVRFLWGVENSLYNYNTDRVASQSTQTGHWGTVYRWDMSSSGFTQASSRDYSLAYGRAQGADYDLLGFNAPAPLLGTTLLGSTPTNVGVLAAGIQYDLNLEQNGLFGAAVYLFDPFTGKLHYDAGENGTFLGTTNLLFRDKQATSYDPISAMVGNANPAMGMMLTPPSAIVEKTNATRYLEGFVVADNRGQIFEGSFKSGDLYLNNKSDWKLRRIASLRNPNETQSGDNYAIPHALTVSRNNDDIWIFGGTANVLGRRIGEDILVPVEKDGVIRNKKQFLFGFKRMPYAEAAAQPAGNSDVVLLQSATQTTFLDKSDSAAKRAADKRAWVIQLDSAYTTPKYGEEYLSAPTILFDDDLYATTFMAKDPETTLTTDGCVATQQVKINGTTRLYCVNGLSGVSGWSSTNPQKYYTLDGIKVGGLTMVTVDGVTRLYMSVSILDDDLRNKYKGQSNVKMTEPGFADLDATYHTSTLISIGKPNPKSKQRSVDARAPQMDYWRELFTQ